MERIGNTANQKQGNVNLKIFQSLEQIIFDLSENNIDESVESSLGLYDEEFPYSFNLIICRLVYSCFVSKRQNEDLYFSYIKLLGTKLEEKINVPNIPRVIEVFSRFLFCIKTQESDYLLEKLIQQNFIESERVKNKQTLYFSHYQEINKDDNLPFSKQFYENIEELKKDEW